MRKNRKLRHHKPHHNGKDRTTGKRVSAHRASEPGDGNKNDKPKSDNAGTNTPKRECSEKEAARREKVKKARAERTKKIRENWRAEREHQPEPCCENEHKREEKNAWLLKELDSIRCDTVIEEGTGIITSNVIPRHFERRKDVQRHMGHFAKVAKDAGYNRYW